MEDAKIAHHTLFRPILKHQKINAVKFAKLLTVLQMKSFLKMVNAKHALLGLNHNRLQEYVAQTSVAHEKNY